MYWKKVLNEKSIQNQKSAKCYNIDKVHLFHQELTLFLVLHIITKNLCLCDYFDTQVSLYYKK